jgi:hypothetical protein
MTDLAKRTPYILGVTEEEHINIRLEEREATTYDSGK